MSETSSKELYEFKKTIKELADKKGRGTELVSVYIPPDKQLSDVAKQMRDELGQSANIKSKQTRKNVQSAIEVIMQRIRLFKQPPEKGLVLFTGMIPKGGPGTEKMETYVFEPPEPIQTYWYICDSTFYLEPLEEMIETKEVYGVVAMDRGGATIATLRGKRIDLLKNIESGVPGNHKAGGQSQRRFDRVIDLAAHEFKKRAGRYVDEPFLPLKENLRGVLVGGPGFNKEEFIKGEYIHYEIKDKIIATIDISYTGEEGIREIIAKSTDILNEMDVIKEKKIVKSFIDEVINVNGLASYGEREVRENLKVGAVDTLLLSENLNYFRNDFECPNCNFTTSKTVKETDANKEILCENCNEKMKITNSNNLIDDLSDLAEETAAGVEIISTETEEGMQLWNGFKGVAAILRYRM